MKPVVPLFYFPFKILFVDDNTDLLKSYHHLEIPNKIATESDPHVAIKDLVQNHIKLVQLFKDITDEQSIDKSTKEHESVLKFTFNEMQDLINNPLKYDKYGVVVVDYKMPEMNGIELCNTINDLNIIKILLTGEYDPLNALDTLNEDTIDCFLQKGQTTSESLLSTINKLTLKYFKHFTHSFLNLAENRFNFLLDQEFINIFNSCIENNKITEYYILNSSGCYLMLNNKNKFIFNIYSDKYLNTFCDMYEYIDKKTLKQIKQRELIPAARLSDDINLKNDFYPCIKTGEYYYNLIKFN